MVSYVIHIGPFSS